MKINKLLSNTLSRHISIAWLVLIISLMATVSAWFLVNQASQQQTKSTIFDYRVERIKNAIINRMLIYQQMLQGAVGLFAASDTVERHEWHNYVENLYLDENYPGIRGVGFSKRILPHEKEAHIAATRAEGGFFANYTLKPAGEREEYTSIIYLEPLDRRNQQAIGYDMFAEATRRTAMARARDTGEPALSGKVTLVQEIDKEVQAGFLIYVPVYRNGLPHQTVAEKRAALLGYVYSPFRMNDLMHGIFGERPSEIDIHIYDGDNINYDNLMYDEMYDEVKDYHTENHQLTYSPQFTSLDTVVIAGHTWTLHFATLPTFEFTTKTYTAHIVLIGGLIMSFLLFGVTRSLETARSLASERQANALLQAEIHERQKVEMALRQSEERFDLAMRGSNDGLWDWNLNTNEVYFSPRWKEMLGYAEHEISNHVDEWRKRVHHDDLQSTMSKVTAYLEQRIPLYENIHRVQHKDRHYLWILDRGFAIWNSESKPIRMVGTHTDLTVLKQTELELQLAKEAAETANRAKSTFLANMSHELRTPLNGILGYAQILRWDNKLTNEQRETIQVIEKSGEYLLTLINDILDLAKVEAGKVELSPTVVPLEGFLRGIVQLFRVRAEQKGILFSYQTISELPGAIKVDEKRLQQILINLIGNAFKFTERGEVTLKVAYQDEILRFEIEDQGIGIATTDLKKIFEPFQQVGDKKYWKQGTGLGLPITKKLTEMMGGELQVASVLGKGSTFTVLLKSVPVSESLQTKNGESTLLKIIGYQGDKRTVLVIDDHAVNLAILVTMLTNVGFIVLAAANGQEGLNQAQKAHFIDLILIDLLMPEVDGFTVIQQLRQIPQCRETVLIAVSASAFAEDHQKSVELGCHDFIAKPIKFDLFFERLQIHLNLTWIYESVTFTNLKETSSLTLPVDLTPGQVTELVKLTESGDIQGILDYAEELEQVEKLTAFARYLHKLARHFNLEEIRKLIEIK
jgi:PAS domain S-box-containing protein